MDSPEVPTLVTERLRLRGIRVSDFEDYADLYADPEVMRHLGGQTWDRGRAWRHMAFAVGHWQLGGAGIWVAEEKATGAFVGVIGFWDPPTWPGFELSYHLVRRSWGQGYATEAAKAALAHAFTVWQRDHVISLIHPKNLPSIRVAERIGERLEGRIEHIGQPMLRYGLDRETYLREVAPPGVSGLRAGLGVVLPACYPHCQSG
ncbi:MAG TPA: GNAT family N-acetyltransferase [Thermoanaerobaculia bacterium]